MKNHYLLTQIADMVVQLYENGVDGIKVLYRTIKEISEALLDSLQRQVLTDEDLTYDRMQIRNNEI